MKLFEKAVLPLSLALAVALGGIAVQGARAVRANAPAGPEGTELPIVMYHHVLKEQARLNKYTVSPDEFRADMEYLRAEGYTPIVVQDLINHVQDGAPLPGRPVMITFDDGYESFHAYVFPILKEYGFRAVYSVVGRYADQYSQVDDHHIRYSHSTWNELREMHESGLVEIQNHSYNLHENQNGRRGSMKKPGEDPAVYRAMLEADLGRLQAACAGQLGWTPTCFTYPFGQISREALPVIKEMGFSAALTCEEKLNYITGDPEQLYHLRRFNRPHGTPLREILERARKG